MTSTRLAILLLLWGVSRPLLAAGAAAVVFDPTNFSANSLTSTQAVITAVEAVVQTANQILELTPLDEVIVRRRLVASIETMGEVLADAEGLMQDLASLRIQLKLLFDLDTAPDTRSGLEARLREIRRYQARQRTIAAQMQTLARTVTSTIHHIFGILDGITFLLGNMSSNQTLIQTQLTIQQTLAAMQTQDAAWQRSETIDRFADALTVESLNKIALKQLEGHPRP